MNPGQRAVLKRLHGDLAQDIIVTEDLLGRCYEAAIFEKDMLQIIAAEKTPNAKVQRLLELLPKRGPQSFDKFAKVIGEDYPWLSEKMHEPNTSTEAGSRRASLKAALKYQAKSVSAKEISISTPRSTGVFDGDIKISVASFVHKRFGQSRKVSEKDKRSIENFVIQHIQEESERIRSQSMEDDSRRSSVFSYATTVSDHNEAHAIEIQQALYYMYRKITPYLLESNEILPSEMNLELLSRKLDDMTHYIETLTTAINNCLSYFDPSSKDRPLDELVEQQKTHNDKLSEMVKEQTQNIKTLYDQVEKDTDQIDTLQKELLECKQQIRAVFLDMGKMRKENFDLKEHCGLLKREITQLKQERSSQSPTRAPGASVRPARPRDITYLPRPTVAKKRDLNQNPATHRPNHGQTEASEETRYTNVVLRYSSTRDDRQ